MVLSSGQTIEKNAAEFNPRVSIIINNYNYDCFLSKAIDSALAQTYSNTEVIVVDDGSTDRSRDIIAEYCDRIIPVLQENSKQGAAFNNGFAHSRGDIIIFLDADDYLYPHAVETIVAAWQPGTAKTHYRLDVVDTEGNPRGFSYPQGGTLSQGNIAATVIHYGTYTGVPTSGNAIHRDVLAQVTPIPDTFKTVADDYLSVLVPLYGEVAAIETPLGAYRIHTSNQWAMTEVTAERFRRFVRHDLQRCELLKQRGQPLGYNVPNDLDVRFFGRVWSRLASLRLDPKQHPVPTDSPLTLAWLGIQALRKYSGFNLQKQIIFSLWFLWVGLMPSPLAKPAIVWLFAPHLRPKAVGQVLSKLRSLATKSANRPEQSQLSQDKPLQQT